MTFTKMEITEEETLCLYGQVCRLEQKLIGIEQELPRRLDEKYMDNQDFLILLNIDKRRSQEWRRRRLVPFSTIGRKFYYPIREVNKLLDKSVIRRRPAKEKSRIYLIVKKR